MCCCASHGSLWSGLPSELAIPYMLSHWPLAQLRKDGIMGEMQCWTGCESGRGPVGEGGVVLRRNEGGEVLEQGVWNGGEGTTVKKLAW